jgi:hypothetical protein
MEPSSALHKLVQMTRRVRLVRRKYFSHNGRSARLQTRTACYRLWYAWVKRCNNPSRRGRTRDSGGRRV